MVFFDELFAGDELRSINGTPIDVPSRAQGVRQQLRDAAESLELEVVFPPCVAARARRSGG